MKVYLCVIVYFLLQPLIQLDLHNQKNDYVNIVQKITMKLEKTSNKKYDVSGVIADTSLKNAANSHFKIDDIYHSLQDCFIFIAAGESNLDSIKGIVGIYKIKSDSILWTSTPLSRDFAGGVLGFVSEAKEINNDGKMEIIITQGKPPIETRQLWIFSWDGKIGKLITQLDNDGESVIYCYGEYKLQDVDGDGIYELLGEWYKNSNSEKMTTVVYSWNGSLYGKWRKSSKYLVKGAKK